MYAVVDSLQDILVGKYENRPIPRTEDDSPAHLHLVAGVFIFNVETGKFLVQKRSPSKSAYPGHFTDSASGHINSDPSLDLHKIKEEMCRELLEEMGAHANPENLILWTIFHEEECNEIKFFFIGTTQDDAIELDPNEVSEKGSGWYLPRELSTLMHKEKFVPFVVGLWKVLIKNAGRIADFLCTLSGWQKYWEYFDDLKRYLAWKENVSKKVPLYIGRFQPFHRGHLKCLKTIRENHDSIIIGIGSAQYSRSDRNPLTVIERRTLLEHVLQEEGLHFTNAFIIPIPDLHDEANWMRNVKLIFENDIVLYSNNDWVRGLAEKEGIQLGDKFLYDRGNLKASRIRELIRAGGEWKQFVPTSCLDNMEKAGLIDRVRQPDSMST